MEESEGALPIRHQVPSDEALLAALGRVSIEHAFLDLVLRRTVKTLAGLSVREADTALAYEGSATLRDLVRRLSAAKLGRAAPAHLKLRALLAECKAVTDWRNELIHHNWVGMDESGHGLLMQADGLLRLQPNAETVQTLADKINAAAQQLNGARLRGGFLAVALHEREGAKLLAAVKKDEE
jgi:hypothetical protein